MSLTTTSPTTTASVAGDGQKGFLDFLGGVLPDLASTVATTVAPSIGIDPRVAGQTVSQVLSVFGIGGPDKAYTPTIPRQESLAQLQQVVGPHLKDPGFATALQHWMRAAIEPVQAHKEGKAYQPSIDLSKGWFDDAISSIGDAVSSVDWGQVAQVGMQALPYVMAAV